MKYSELISELEYWKRISEEKNPKVVINYVTYSYTINSVQPVKGIKNKRAIGIIFET